MRRGVYRSYYKGHKDKIKGEGEVGEGGWTGWGGVEGRGENADNCNLSLIHISEPTRQESRSRMPSSA